MPRALACLLLALAVRAAPAETVVLDFKEDKLPAGWTTTGNWKPEKGVLRGEGDGSLAWAGPLPGDFQLAFKGFAAEKTNFEVKLFDVADGRELYTFAFLGRFHSVLDGVKSCILREQQFVKVEPRMWIFPGREFRFEVRSAKGQLQMFLDGELGPFVADPAPLFQEHGVRLQILASTEGKRDAVRLDDVTVTFAKAVK